MKEHIVHTIAPVYDENSRVLVLGTIPSPKSRAYGFYYSNPQNRFWRVLCELLEKPLPLDNEEKRSLVLGAGVALWDVLRECDIRGADDTSISKPVANDIGTLLRACPIRAVFTTGAAATGYYRRLCLPRTGVESVYLPSTSPANCRHYCYDDLVREYRVILRYL